jgi:hypothetical protein
MTDDECVVCGVGPRGAFLVDQDGETQCRDCADGVCVRCGAETNATTISGEFKCRDCQNQIRESADSREEGQGALDDFATDGGRGGSR